MIFKVIRNALSWLLQAIRQGNHQCITLHLRTRPSMPFCLTVSKFGSQLAQNILFLILSFRIYSTKLWDTLTLQVVELLVSCLAATHQTLCPQHLVKLLWLAARPGFIIDILLSLSNGLHPSADGLIGWAEFSQATETWRQHDLIMN